jgi:hypothetical protein
MAAAPALRIDGPVTGSDIRCRRLHADRRAGWVQSTPGEGSTFSVLLPAVVAVPAA